MTKYEATVGVDTKQATADIKSLKSTLASTIWALKALGLPPDAVRSLIQIQRSIQYFRMMQMLASGGMGMNVLSMGLRMAGLSKVTGGIRIIKKASQLGGS